MNDSSIVSGCQSARQFHAVVQHLAQPHRAFAKAIAQGLALQQLGHDIRRSVVLADVKNGDNVGMVEGGGGLGFLLKAAKPFGIARPVLGQYLDRNVAFQRGVAGAIDLAHAARA